MEVDRIMSIDVYEQIPVMESDKFLLREIEDTDAEDLLKVYSDKVAVPLFNSDNCVNGFYYVSLEKMKDTIAFWKREYRSRYYVRWAIIDKKANCAIGTIELFNRKAKDYFNNCGLLRLDLRSDYEKQGIIEDILGIIIPEAKEMFSCEMIATKAISIAKERISALEHMGFCLSEEALIGHDGTKYDSYYVREV
jgi:RimJ/RimL family protein N-acetyltransferase